MQRVLVLAFVAAFGTWLLVSLFAIANRLYADARRRRLAHATGGDAPDQRGLEQLIRDAAPQRAVFRWRRIEAQYVADIARALGVPANIPSPSGKYQRPHDSYS